MKTYLVTMKHPGDEPVPAEFWETQTQASSVAQATIQARVKALHEFGRWREVTDVREITA